MKIKKIGLLCSFLIFFLAGCSSSQKKNSSDDVAPIALSQLHGKKIVLSEIHGESTAKKIIEVALVNQLVKEGSFILLAKKEIEKLRHQYDTDTSDMEALAKQAGADYSLQIRVIEFEASFHEGHFIEEVEDSQYEEEQGNSEKLKKTFQIKTLEGRVKAKLEFRPLKEGDKTLSGTAQAYEKIEKNNKKEAIQFPPKLGFLENLTNKAFRDFFDRYNH